MTKKTPTTGSDTSDITNLMDVFADTPIENIDGQISATEDQVIDRELDAVKTTADAGDIDKAKELLSALLQKFPQNKKLSSQKKDIQQHISSKKIDAELKQALELYDTGEYQKAKRVLNQIHAKFSLSQQTLYTECLNKIDKKLEEQDIIAMNTQLQKAIGLFNATEYAKAIPLIEAIDPITDEQKKEKLEYSQKLHEKADEIVQEQIASLRKQLAQDMHTKSSEDLIKDIEHIQALINTIKNQNIRDTFLLFPEKDIIENLCKACIQRKDDVFTNIWRIGKKLDIDSIILRRLYKLDHTYGFDRKDVDRILGIHRPFLGLGEITVDDIDTRLLVSTILKTYAIKKTHNTGITSLLKKIEFTENINEKAKDDGWTLLMCAISEGHTDIVKLLLKYPKIDVNAKSKPDKKTALYVAAVRGHTDIVKLLLKHNEIDVNAKNKEGDTPYMIAKEKGHKDIVELLAQHPDIHI